MAVETRCQGIADPFTPDQTEEPLLPDNSRTGSRRTDGIMQGRSLYAELEARCPNRGGVDSRVNEILCMISDDYEVLDVRSYTI
jgi:hypothetical protein